MPPKLLKPDFFLLLLIFFSGPVSAQQIYQAGLSRESIEPSTNLISLSLGGYAAPWEGRFTLQWIHKDHLMPVTAITGFSDKLFLISNDHLFQVTPNPSGNISELEQTGRTGNFKLLAGSNGKLLAINNEGVLFTSKINGKGIEWEEKGFINPSVTAMAAGNDELFLAHPDGTFWKADISPEKIQLQEIESLKLSHIVSLATSHSQIYALTRNGTIFRCGIKQKNQWVKAAWKNGVTIREDIRHLAIVDNAIYGIDKNNILFEGEHRSKGDLSVRAMAVKNDPNTVLIISLDLLGINSDFSRLIKDEIYKTTKIPPAAVFINVSHTHFAPVTQIWPTWQEFNQLPDSIYLGFVKRKILRAVDQAISNMRPVHLFFGRETTNMGFNRSLKDHPELYDRDVDVIKVDFVDSGKENYLFLAACHPVHSNSGKFHYTLSANFPGVARKLVEQRTGTSNAVFLQGAAGDINPVDNDEYLTGKKLANKVIAVLYRSMDKVSGPVSFILDTINIPVEVKTKEEMMKFKEQNRDKPGDMIAERNFKWCERMLAYYETDKMPAALPVFIQTINIGNWKLIGFSRETTSEYSLAVKDLWPDQPVSVAGFTNDVSSYLPTRKHIERKNYEGYDSFFWYGMPGTFPVTVKDTIVSFIKRNGHDHNFDTCDKY